MKLVLPVLSVLAAMTACVAAIEGPPGSRDPQPTSPPAEPPVKPPQPTPATYVRGSMAPLYQLMPRAEYNRLTERGVSMADRDFIATGSFASAAQKLDQVGAQIAAERGAGSLDLLPRAEDRQRASQVPFRGNPSDVDIVDAGGRSQAFVPLGGDLMTVGNEVAAVDLDAGTVVRIKVGVHPQRTAAHPSGLIFVCNQYSNYVSVIDAASDELLRTSAGPVEIKTEMYCTDLLLVPRIPQVVSDDVDLYVANGWRGSVLKYGLTIVRDPRTDRPIDVRVSEPAAPSPANQPAAEITGVGANPYRLSLGQDQRSIYVANNRGGELARIDLASRAVRRVALGAPTIDVVQVNDVLLVPTTMPDRGLLARDDTAPRQLEAAPVLVQGLDGEPHLAHPGSQRDGTRSYNFEDVRNGLFVVGAQLTSATAAYFTDDNSGEPSFSARQKILNGAIPQAVVRNAAGTRAYLALSGSDKVQEVQIQGGAFRVADVPGRTFETGERPFALALDEPNQRLLVASWGGETLDVIDVTTGTTQRRIDLGYAGLDYPATNIERGEYFYYNADWSNNGRKACATCHVDELLVDGFAFANGATAPTAMHQVPPSFNLLTTDSYFWNGSFVNGSYASLASDAQTRTNCELILFGLTEGPGSDPATRKGDPANRVKSIDDPQCRPVVGQGPLPDNFADISKIIANEKLVRNQLVERETGLPFNDVARLMDFFSVAELRLPPNPLHYLAEQGQLDSATTAQLTRGESVFRGAGCAGCHPPDNARHPYADGSGHGGGSTWTQQFVSAYQRDRRLVDAIGGIPQVMLDAIRPSSDDAEVNMHVDPIDYFIPFCFDAEKCLAFEDPLAVRGNQQLETERLSLLVTINLANADRGFVPGNVIGRPTVNTSSLRGVWWQSNYLHNGLARSLSEAVLAPGHPALRPGENGFAINAVGQIDVHGHTSDLGAEDIAALNLFVQSIE